MNYLKMDVTRLFKTRSFYLSLLMALLLLGLFALASWLLSGVMREIQREFSPGAGTFAGMNPEQVAQQARKLFNVSRFSSFFLNSPSLTHLILVVFAASFISKDHQSGYLKNLFVIPGLRGKWLLSKLLTMLLAAVIYYAVIILGAIAATLLYGNTPVLNLRQLGSYFGLQITVDMALVAVLCLTVAFFQTKTSAVVTGMLLSFNMQAIIYLLLDQTGLYPFKLFDYGMMNLAGNLDIATFGGAAPDLLSSMMSQFGGSSDPTTAAQLLPVSLGVFTVAVVLSAFTLRYRDYKG